MHGYHYIPRILHVLCSDFKVVTIRFNSEISVMTKNDDMYFNQESQILYLRLIIDKDLERLWGTSFFLCKSKKHLSLSFQKNIYHAPWNRKEILRIEIMTSPFLASSFYYTYSAAGKQALKTNFQKLFISYQMILSASVDHLKAFIII